MLKKNLLALGFGVLAFGGLASADGFNGLEVLAQPAPATDLVLTKEDGSEIPLSGAPVTVLNFWATWCAPCVAEMPTLIALDEHFADQGLRVVGASLDRSFGQMNAFWSNQGWSDAVEIALDHKGSLFREFSSDELGATGVPYTAVLNDQGQVLSWFAGDTEWDSPEVLAYFDGLLADLSQ